MKGIKLNSQSFSYDSINNYELDYGMFSVKATMCVTIWKVYPKLMSNEVYESDIHDGELEFYINGKKTLYKGFKDMYKSMFGDGKFEQLKKEINENIEEYYYINTEFPDIKYINKDNAAICLEELISSGEFKSNSITIGGRKLLYMSSRTIIMFAKKADPDSVCKLLCTSAYNPDLPARNREVYVVSTEKA